MAVTAVGEGKRWWFGHGLGGSWQLHHALLPRLRDGAERGDGGELGSRLWFGKRMMAMGGWWRWRWWHGFVVVHGGALTKAS